MDSLPVEVNRKSFEGGFLKKPWNVPPKQIRTFGGKTFYKVSNHDESFAKNILETARPHVEYLLFVKSLRDIATDRTMLDREELEEALVDAAAGRMERERHVVFQEQICALAIPHSGIVHDMNVITALRKGCVYKRACMHAMVVSYQIHFVGAHAPLCVQSGSHEHLHARART